MWAAHRRRSRRSGRARTAGDGRCVAAKAALSDGKAARGIVGLPRDWSPMQPDQRTSRILVVAARTADPFPLVERVRERARAARIDATVVVPASLRGLEWIGDPMAEV